GEPRARRDPRRAQAPRPRRRGRPRLVGGPPHRCLSHWPPSPRCCQPARHAGLRGGAVGRLLSLSPPLSAVCACLLYPLPLAGEGRVGAPLARSSWLPPPRPPPHAGEGAQALRQVAGQSRVSAGL